MKQIIIKLCLLLSVCFCWSRLKAQEATTATGGNAFGTGGTVSYSYGQIINATITGTGVSVSPGVQQPYEISVVLGMETSNEIFLNISTYPNPTTNYLILKSNNYVNENLIYRLYDNNGKILVSKKVKDNESLISMTNFKTAIYFLKVFSNNREVKSFKINKIN